MVSRGLKSPDRWRLRLDRSSTAGVSRAGSYTNSRKRDSSISPPKSQLPNETSHEGALVVKARRSEGLVNVHHEPGARR